MLKYTKIKDCEQELVLKSASKRVCVAVMHIRNQDEISLGSRYCELIVALDG